MFEDVPSNQLCHTRERAGFALKGVVDTEPSKSDRLSRSEEKDTPLG